MFRSRSADIDRKLQEKLRLRMRASRQDLQQRLRLIEIIDRELKVVLSRNAQLLGPRRMEVRVREAVVWGMELEHFALSAQKNSQYVEHARFDALAVSACDRIRVGSSPIKYCSSRELGLLNKLMLKVSPSVAPAPNFCLGSVDPVNHQRSVSVDMYRLDTATDNGATQYIHRQEIRTTRILLI
tara:strand:+ start:975 stop:1526 length:552 start_codon:yes stop_codon:yes gene_type:complete